MKLSSLFKNSSQNSSSSTPTSTSPSPWPWSLPTCGKPKTLSFRLEKNQHNIFNSTYHLDDINDTTSYSFDDFFSEIDETSSSSTTTINGQDCIEKVIKGLRLEKERLFFEPEETSSILDFQENKNISITSTNINVVDEGNIISFVPMGLDSNDPFVDFRKSMEEMVEAYEIKGWENLEELLTCYLKVNCKSNHGYIVGAFVDLLVNLATFSDNNNNNINVGVGGDAGVGVGVDESTIIMTTIDEEQQCLSSSTTTTTTSHSFTSPLSFCSSSCSTSSSITSTSACLSLLLEEDEVIQRKKQC